MVLKPSRFYKIIQQMKKVILLNFIFLTFLFAISAQSEVFIIVHGTWSSFSPWHRCKSSFFKALEQNASKDTHVVGFNWNGKNSYQDRKLAAQELKNLILSKIKSEKTASSIIYKSIYCVFIIKFITQIPILFKFHKTYKKTIGF